jgi:hypothetical protein
MAKILTYNGPLESLIIFNGTLITEVALGVNVALCLRDVSTCSTYSAILGSHQS